MDTPTYQVSYPKMDDQADSSAEHVVQLNESNEKDEKPALARSVSVVPERSTTDVSIPFTGASLVRVSRTKAFKLDGRVSRSYGDCEALRRALIEAAPGRAVPRVPPRSAQTLPLRAGWAHESVESGNDSNKNAEKDANDNSSSDVAAAARGDDQLAIDLTLWLQLLQQDAQLGATAMVTAFADPNLSMSQVKKAAASLPGAIDAPPASSTTDTPQLTKMDRMRLSLVFRMRRQLRMGIAKHESSGLDDSIEDTLIFHQRRSRRLLANARLLLNHHVGVRERTVQLIALQRKAATESLEVVCDSELEREPVASACAELSEHAAAHARQQRQQANELALTLADADDKLRALRLWKCAVQGYCDAVDKFSLNRDLTHYISDVLVSASDKSTSRPEVNPRVAALTARRTQSRVLCAKIASALDSHVPVLNQQRLELLRVVFTNNN